MAQPALSLLDAYAQVHYGDVSPDAFLDAVYSGAPSPEVLPRSRVRGELLPTGIAVWEGPIPDAVGHYMSAAAYDVAAIARLDERARHNGFGLRAADIVGSPSIFVEVDEALDGGRLPIEDQLALYDSLEAETGLRWSAVVLSGDTRPSAHEALNGRGTLVPGKSAHAHLSTWIDTSQPEQLAQRQRAADALCVLSGGDPAVRDLARKSRLGGALARELGVPSGGRARVQTALRAEIVSYPIGEIVERLEAACARRGLVVATALDALQTAARARTMARAWEKAAASGTASSQEAVDAAEALREVALEVRRAQAVSASHRRLLTLVGAPRGQVAITTQTGASRVISTGYESDAWDAGEVLITHTSGQSGYAQALWDSLRRDYRVPDVHCVRHADAHASAFLTRSTSGRFTVHCPTCGALRSRSSGPQLAPATLDGIADLEPAAPQAAPAAPQAAPHLTLVPAPAQAAAPAPRAPQRRVVATPPKRGPGRPKAADVAKERHQRLVEVDEAKVAAARATARHLFAPHLDDVDDLTSPLTPAQIALAQAPPPPPPDVVSFDSKGDVSLALHCGREALARLDKHARDVAYCRRGPILHTARADRDTICSKRIACWSASCPACGPKMARGLQAALAGWTAEHLGGFRGQVVVLPAPMPGAIRKAISLWGSAGTREASPYPSLRGDAPPTTSRVVLGIEASPGVATVILAWPSTSPKDAPTGALAKHLASYGAVDLEVSPAEALLTLADTIDLDAHRVARSGRVCLLLGGAIPRGQVAELRDALVGRARGASKADQERFAEDKKAGKIAVVRTYQSLPETIEALGGVRAPDADYEEGQIVVVSATSTTAGATSQKVDWMITGFSALQSQAQWQRARAAVPPGESIRALELPHGPTPVDFLQSLRQSKPGAAPEIHRKTPLLIDLDAVKSSTFSIADTPIARQKGKKTA
ncbi:hypothetical protein L6R46_22635 [Myxococcota bacterium]|nr:hypothetical protein [Myxococcota bacterium]